MFTIIFTNVAMFLAHMLLGFILCKTKKVDINHSKSLSTIMLFVMSPCMILNSFLQQQFDPESFKKMITYFAVTLLLQLLFMGILYIIFARKYDDARYRILSAGGVLGNVGFFGMPLIASIFPDEPIVLCYSAMNIMSMNLIVFTIGVFMITNDKKFISLRSAILNPTSLTIIASLPIYILGINFPNAVRNSVEVLAKAVTPTCMIILGMRLATVSLKKVFTRPFVYATCGMKLVLFPIFAYLCVRWLPFFDDVFKTTVIVLACAPAGAIIESLAELHDKEQEFAANVVLLTTILSIVTIPVVTHFLI